jgi:hypothetical protein
VVTLFAGFSTGDYPSEKDRLNEREATAATAPGTSEKIGFDHHGGSSVQSSSIGTLWYQALRVDPLTFTTWPIDQTEEGRDRILANILAAMQAGTNYQLDATTWLNGKQMVSVQKLN